MNQKLKIFYSISSKIFTFSKTYQRQIQKILNTLDNSQSIQQEGIIKDNKAVRKDHKETYDKDNQIKFKKNQCSVNQARSEPIENILRDIQKISIDGDTEKSLLDVYQQNASFLKLIEKLQYYAELRIVSLNEIITTYTNSFLHTKADQKISQKIHIQLDQIVSNLLSYKYMIPGVFDLKEIGIVSSIIYTAELNKYGSTKQIVNQIFDDKKLEEILEQDMSFDQELDFQFLILSLKPCISRTRYQVQLTEKLFQTLQNQKPSEKNSDRTIHLLNILQRTFARVEQQEKITGAQGNDQEQINIVNQQLKSSITKVFLVQMERIQFIKVEDFLATFIDLKDQIQAVHSLTKITTTFVNNNNSFNYVFRLFQTFEIAQLEIIKDHKLILLLQTAIMIAQQRFYQGKFATQLIIQRIEIVILNEKISQRVQLSIIYELYFRDSYYQSTALEPLLFSMDCQQMTVYDLIQFCYCLRKYQKPTTKFINKFDDAFVQINLRMDEITNYISIKRLITVLDNQTLFYQKSRRPQDEERRIKEVTDHLGNIEDILKQLKSKLLFKKINENQSIDQ